MSVKLDPRIKRAIASEDLDFLEQRSDIGEIAKDDRYFLFMIEEEIGSTELLELFLKNGADPNVKDDRGGDFTPIMCISTYHAHPERYEQVKLLIEHKADVNYRSEVAASRDAFSTPLQCALRTTNNLDTIQLLLDSGAKIEDDTLFIFLIAPKYIELLIDRGANVDAVHKNRTPLEFFAWCLRKSGYNIRLLENMKVLLDHGADPSPLLNNSKHTEELTKFLKSYRRSPFHPRMLRKLEIRQICTLLWIQKIDWERDVEEGCIHCFGVLPFELLKYIIDELVGML